MFGISWKHPVKRKVMIECLYAEGLHWAGWYRDGNLIAQWDRIMGRHGQGALKRGTHRTPQRWALNSKSKAKTHKGGQFIDWSELDRWLAEG